jgi:hypothetical protein
MLCKESLNDNVEKERSCSSQRTGWPFQGIVRTGKGRDMTGGAQRWVASAFPGACYAGKGVRYVSVCGRTVTSSRRDRRTETMRRPMHYAHDAYLQVENSIPATYCHYG